MAAMKELELQLEKEAKAFQTIQKGKYVSTQIK
jgi:hypothetical protein